MTKTAKNQKILKAAKAISQAMEAEMEDILSETEQLVKKYVPAKYVKAALRKLEEHLDDNAIEACFDKTVTTTMRKKTASLQATPAEVKEALNKIACAAVDEAEDMLADANEVANRVLTRFASSERPEIEAKLKNLIENRMHNIGIYCKFDRITYDPQAAMKKAIANIKSKKQKAASKSSGNSILDAMYRDSAKM